MRKNSRKSKEIIRWSSLLQKARLSFKIWSEIASLNMTEIYHTSAASL